MLYPFSRSQYSPLLCRTHKGLGPEALDQLNAECFDCGTPVCCPVIISLSVELALFGNIGMFIFITSGPVGTEHWGTQIPLWQMADSRIAV